MELGAPGILLSPQASPPRPPAPAALAGWVRSLQADSRCGAGTKRHRSGAAAGRTHRGAAAPLRTRPAPPQLCERPPTPLLLPEGSACCRRCHCHSLRRRCRCRPCRRRRPVAEAAQPPRFRSSSRSRENFRARPRPAPPPRDFPRRKGPSAQALLLGRAPAGGPSGRRGACARPPSSRWHPQGSAPEAL